MNTEIERKFLVQSDAWRPGAEGMRISQGYLSTDKARTVRVRISGEHAWLTIKGLQVGITRLELEYPISLADARLMLDTLCLQPIIDKTRYRRAQGPHIWEIDEFHGANAGLVLAEIELGAEDEAFDRPEWLGEEVSQDSRYFNSSLIERPFGIWVGG